MELKHTYCNYRYEQVNDRIREKIAHLTKQIEQIKEDKRSNMWDISSHTKLQFLQ